MTPIRIIALHQASLEEEVHFTAPRNQTVGVGMAIGLLASEGTFYQQRASFGRGTPRCAGVGQCHLALNVEGTSPSGRLEKSIKEHIEGGSEGATGRRVPHNLYRPSVVCELLGIERKRHVIQVAHDKHWRLARQM